jgi:hypothetical protein
MIAKIAATLAALVAVYTAARADVDIVVRRQGSGDSVIGAEVRIEEVDNKASIDKGMTDADGKFTSSKLPGTHHHVCVTVFPPTRSNLTAKTVDAVIGTKAIVIVLRAKLR